MGQKKDRAKKKKAAAEKQGATPPTAEDGACAVCLEPLVDGRQRLDCGHILHEACVREFRRYGTAGTCPICRRALPDLLPARALLERAVLKRLQGEHSSALGLCTRALELDPELHDARHLMAEVCLDTGSYVRAFELLSAVHEAGVACAGRLAFMHFHGLGTAQSTSRAEALLCEAYEGGEPAAQHLMADMRANVARFGDGPPRAGMAQEALFPRTRAWGDAVRAQGELLARPDDVADDAHR